MRARVLTNSPERLLLLLLLPDDDDDDNDTIGDQQDLQPPGSDKTDKTRQTRAQNGSFFTPEQARASSRSRGRRHRKQNVVRPFGKLGDTQISERKAREDDERLCRETVRRARFKR